MPQSHLNGALGQDVQSPVQRRREARKRSVIERERARESQRERERQGQGQAKGEGESQRDSNNASQNMHLTDALHMQGIIAKPPHTIASKFHVDELCTIIMWSAGIQIEV